ISAALARAGARMEDVVRTRLFVTRISEWEQIGRAHGDFFGKIRPTTAMIEVSLLVSSDMLVEIEAEAIIGARASSSTEKKSKSTTKKSTRPKTRSKAR